MRNTKMVLTSSQIQCLCGSTSTPGDKTTQFLRKVSGPVRETQEKPQVIDNSLAKDKGSQKILKKSLKRSASRICVQSTPTKQPIQTISTPTRPSITVCSSQNLTTIPQRPPGRNTAPLMMMNFKQIKRQCITETYMQQESNGDLNSSLQTTTFDQSISQNAKKYGIYSDQKKHSKNKSNFGTAANITTQFRFSNQQKTAVQKNIICPPSPVNSYARHSHQYSEVGNPNLMSPTSINSSRVHVNTRTVSNFQAPHQLFVKPSMQLKLKKKISVAMLKRPSNSNYEQISSNFVEMGNGIKENDKKSTSIDYKIPLTPKPKFQKVLTKEVEYLPPPSPMKPNPFRLSLGRQQTQLTTFLNRLQTKSIVISESDGEGSSTHESIILGHDWDLDRDDSNSNPNEVSAFSIMSKVHQRTQSTATPLIRSESGDLSEDGYFFSKAKFNRN